ncbi:alpha/beta hydrolase domain-containing protein, partial [Streptomyces sp. DSM 44915]
ERLLENQGNAGGRLADGGILRDGGRTVAAIAADQCGGADCADGSQPCFRRGRVGAAAGRPRRTGYVEEEFFVSGKANVYDWPAGGAVIRTPDAPYTTRVLVRRPAAKTRFSGRVVVEMLNPSNLMDLNIGWAIHH